MNINILRYSLFSIAAEGQEVDHTFVTFMLGCYFGKRFFKSARMCDIHFRWP